jgi:hypothetical protein
MGLIGLLVAGGLSWLNSRRLVDYMTDHHNEMVRSFKQYESQHPFHLRWEIRFALGRMDRQMADKKLSGVTGAVFMPLVMLIVCAAGFALSWFL